MEFQIVRQISNFDLGYIFLHVTFLEAEKVNIEIVNPKRSDAINLFAAWD